MIEEKTFARIERDDGSHVLVGERKVEYVDILLHPLDMCRFGDDDYTTLNKPT